MIRRLGEGVPVIPCKNRGKEWGGGGGSILPISLTQAKKYAGFCILPTSVTQAEKKLSL